MRAMCSREIFTKKCLQQQIFDSDLKGAWHYNHVTFTPIAKNFMLYCRLIYMLSILCVRLTIKVKVRIPESPKVGGYSPIKTGSSHLKRFTPVEERPNAKASLKLPRTQAVLGIFAGSGSTRGYGKDETREALFAFHIEPSLVAFCF